MNPFANIARLAITPILILGAVLALLLSPTTSTAAPPNILWITCEDLSPRLACYGDTTAATPNLDQLARESVRYNHAYGVYGVCAPNRHALITGMYPTTTGGMHMRTWKRSSVADLTRPDVMAIPLYEATPAAEVRCFPEYLRAAGYFCTNNSKTDYQFRPYPTIWDASGRGAHWRQRPRPNQPFFAVFNSTVTHESKLFQQTSPMVVDPQSVDVPPYYPDTPIVRRSIARQYDNLIRLDDWVGNLLQQLAEDGLSETTYVFFFSDHGDGLPRMKRWAYDSGIHVPLLVRHPGQDQPRTSNDLVSFVDFAPTVLSLAGVDLPKHMQGRAFPGAQAKSPRKYVYAARDRMDTASETIRAVRDHRFKYVRNYRPELPYLGDIAYRDQLEIMQEIHRMREADELGPHHWQFWAKTKPLEELYDTESDPYEIHNLASDPTYYEKLSELRTAHEKWQRVTKDLGHLPESELVRLLWPPDGIQPTTQNPIVNVVDGAAVLTCSSPGASIGYQSTENDRWLLYSQPFPVEAGDRFKVRAFRMGWKPSDVVEHVVD